MKYKLIFLLSVAAGNAFAQNLSANFSPQGSFDIALTKGKLIRVKVASLTECQQFCQRQVDCAAIVYKTPERCYVAVNKQNVQWVPCGTGTNCQGFNYSGPPVVDAEAAAAGVPGSGASPSTSSGTNSQSPTARKMSNAAAVTGQARVEQSSANPAGSPGTGRRGTAVKGQGNGAGLRSKSTGKEKLQKSDMVSLGDYDVVAKPPQALPATNARTTDAIGQTRNAATNARPAVNGVTAPGVKPGTAVTQNIAELGTDFHTSPTHPDITPGQESAVIQSVNFTYIGNKDIASRPFRGEVKNLPSLAACNQYCSDPNVDCAAYLWKPPNVCYYVPQANKIMFIYTRNCEPNGRACQAYINRKIPFSIN